MPSEREDLQRLIDWALKAKPGDIGPVGHNDVSLTIAAIRWLAEVEARVAELEGRPQHE